MGRFVRHEPCSKCGSKDNLARYEDGSAYCFGCGYRERADGSSPEFRARLFKGDVVEEDAPCKPLPDDTSRSYGEAALEWVYQYGITVPELLRFDVRWSERSQQLINPFFEDGKLVMWSARNFGSWAKQKYFVSGDKNNVGRVFRRDISGSTDGRDTRLVIVEDCMSAIKTARYSDSMPCLGSSLTNKMIASLRSSYDLLDVWLDGNKMDNAQDIARRAQLLGFKTRVIYTEKDPKEISDDEIVSRLVQ